MNATGASIVAMHGVSVTSFCLSSKRRHVGGIQC